MVKINLTYKIIIYRQINKRRVHIKVFVPQINVYEPIQQHTYVLFYFSKHLYLCVGIKIRRSRGVGLLTHGG